MIEAFDRLAREHADEMADAQEEIKTLTLQQDMLVRALERLLDCPALNMDELENEDEYAIALGYKALARINAN